MGLQHRKPSKMGVQRHRADFRWQSKIHVPIHRGRFIEDAQDAIGGDADIAHESSGFCWHRWLVCIQQARDIGRVANGQNKIVPRTLIGAGISRAEIEKGVGDAGAGGRGRVWLLPRRAALANSRSRPLLAPFAWLLLSRTLLAMPAAAKHFAVPKPGVPRPTLPLEHANPHLRTSPSLLHPPHRPITHPLCQSTRRSPLLSSSKRLSGMARPLLYVFSRLCHARAPHPLLPGRTS